jgi:ribosome-binding factor A
MVSKLRAERIGERIREELMQMLLQEVGDPRVDGISITEVRVDRELAYADVYVSAFEGPQRWKEIHDGLESASGFLRRELMLRIELRSFPKLRFKWDKVVERAERVEELFSQLHAEERQRQAEQPPEPEDGAADEDQNAS